jgi:hypothetical protein
MWVLRCEIQKEITELLPSYVASCLGLKAYKLKKSGKRNAALNFQQESVRIWREAARKIPEFLPFLASALATQAKMQRNSGQLNEALNSQQESVRIWDKDWYRNRTFRFRHLPMTAGLTRSAPAWTVFFIFMFGAFWCLEKRPKKTGRGRSESKRKAD